MRWPWQKAPDRTREVEEHLRRVMDREAEVKDLSQSLREAQRRNHFSELVNVAISRVSREGNR